MPLTADTLSKNRLEFLYRKFNNRAMVPYDPIKYVYQFEDEREREAVGLLASCFSFGRVSQIFKAVDRVMQIMEKRPLDYIACLGPRPDSRLSSFQYRFVRGRDVFHLMTVIKKILLQYGSIHDFAASIYKKGELFEFLQEFMVPFKRVYYLVPCSLKNSSCKRLFMFLRWMVRKDNIDLGLWRFIHPRELVIPLDTHIMRISQELGWTRKKSASLGAAMEITENLRKYSKDDPVRYDWALSHVPILENNFTLLRNSCLNSRLESDFVA